MCTSLAFKANDFYFGRNMDLDYDFAQRVVITPRNYSLTLKHEKTLNHHHAIIGMATVINGYPLYAEGANEMGLCVSAQNFPGNAHYENSTLESALNLAPYEIIPYVLSNFATVSEAEKGLENLKIIDTPFDDNTPTTPLHFMISDQDESIVLEPSKNGVKIFKNHVGVMTNNPPFDAQLDTLENYKHLIVKRPTEGAISLGLDLQGLPGDFSSSSRFIRLAILKKITAIPETEDEALALALTLMKSVASPKGIVLTKDGKPHYTIYTCVINATKGEYHFMTSKSPALKSVALSSARLTASHLLEYPL